MKGTEKLDKILEWMSANITNFHSKEICQKSGLDVDDNEAYLLLDKLRTDGYVDSIPRNDRVFNINYSGIMFHLSGGYTKQLSDIRARRNLDRLLTLIIATGTGLAGLYGLFEIVKYIASLFAC